MEGHTAREGGRQSENPPVHIPAAKNSLRNKQLPTAAQSIRRGGGGEGWGVADPFINQTAGAEPRRAPLNRKPPGVFERNILQLYSPAFPHQPLICERLLARARRNRSDEPRRVFLDARRQTAPAPFVTFRAPTALISRSRGGGRGGAPPLRFPRGGDCTRTGNVCAWRGTEAKRRRGKCGRF